MKKSRAVISLLLVAAITCLMAYTVLIGFGKGHRGSYHNIKKGLDLAGGASITYQAVGEQPPSQEDLNDTKYKLQRRVDQYSTEAQVYTEGTDRLNIEIPGISGVAETNKILEDLGRPGSLYFIRQTDAEGKENYQLGVTEEGSIEYTLTKDLDKIIADGDAVVTGTQVTDAKAGYQQDDMGNKQIVYDGHFVSVPSVQAAITDGRAVITGENTIEEAENLASTIRIGGLKVELERLRSQIVGAQLGQDAIRTSKFAGMVGFALVALLMIVIYLLPGFSAVLALCIYVLMMALVLNGFDITLTLPGIAGILLSVGMAVDANVIIFARIREELATGIGVRTAINNGYHKALSAIIDGNVTTLIAAAVLAVLGSGSVKGFAYTLAIGIILSMITSLFVTRLIMNIFYGLGLTDKKLYGVGKKRNPVAFVEHRKIFFAVSIAMVLAGFVAMGVFQAKEGNPLNYSLDFVGGTATSVSFNEDMSLADIEKQVIPVFTKVTGDNNVQVQKVAGSNEVIFKSAVLDTEKSTELSNQLVEKFKVNKDSITSETISSTISDEMKRDALIAVGVALVLMLLYIWFRFKDLRFGASSVLCLAHDVLVVLAFYAFVRISVGSTFIACMLTIVGYSINATIVIFDRVRESLRTRVRNQSLAELVNESVTDTLSRSIFTSLTTFFMVLTLFIFGVASVKEFALPIMIGIICGAYSSVCLAGSIWYVLRKKADDAAQAAAPAKKQSSGSGSQQSKKKKDDYSNLSKKERRERRRKEEEAKNKSKITV